MSGAVKKNHSDEDLMICTTNDRVIYNVSFFDSSSRSDAYVSMETPSKTLLLAGL